MIFSSGRIQATELLEDSSVGVLLTALGPGHGRAKILANNYGARDSKKQMADYYFRIDIKNIPGVLNRSLKPDLWIAPGDIPVPSSSQHGFYFNYTVNK